MKVFLVSFFLVLICFNANAATMSPADQDMIDVAFGLMMGLNVTQKVPDLINCVMGNEQTVVDNMKNLISDFKSFKILDAFSEVQSFLTLFGTGTTCGNMTAEGKQYIDTLIDAFKDPAKVKAGDARIFGNLTQVLGLIGSGLTDCGAKNYYKCALDFSSIFGMYLGFD